MNTYYEIVEVHLFTTGDSELCQNQVISAVVFNTIRYNFFSSDE